MPASEATVLPPPHNRRYAYVDLLRGLAALTVLICHYQWFYSIEPGEWLNGADLPLEGLLWPVYRFGGTAVQLFWVLSGFVFIIRYGADGRRLALGQFAVSRIARLYPLHLATLLIVAALQWASKAQSGEFIVYSNNDVPHFVAQLFLASNWFTMEHSFNAPIWSVSVEVLIYAAFALFMRSVGASLSAAIALVAAGYLATHWLGSPITSCLALFFAGASLAIALPWAQRTLGRTTIPLAILGLGVAVYIPGLLVYLGAPCAVALFASLDHQLPALPTRWHWIGAITYSVYLLHMPVLIAARLLLGDRLTPWLPHALTLMLFVSVVIILSILSFRHFELPAQKWVRRQLGGIPARKLRRGEFGSPA
jgi:peptidoglycan/LPS O-acetylase OafA/YrhL